MSGEKACKIQNDRLNNYTNRIRLGSTQVFFTGSDERDFKRYRSEGGAGKSNVKMHDKPDTIRLRHNKRHYYAQLIDGAWWWVNGCAECNGRPRNWMTYVECEKHDVCKTCGIAGGKLKTHPYGGEHGWQCRLCHDAEKEAIKIERLREFAKAEYDESDFLYCDMVKCPHCGFSYEPDSDTHSKSEICDICGGEYSLDTDYSITYSTKVIGERVKA